jgi:hypothetical protein
VFSARASQIHGWMMGDLVKPDPNGAPILYIQGLAARRHDATDVHREWDAAVSAVSALKIDGRHERTKRTRARRSGLAFP